MDYEIHLPNCTLVFGREPDGTLFVEWRDREDEPLGIRTKTSTPRACDKLLARAHFARQLRLMGEEAEEIASYWDLLDW